MMLVKPTTAAAAMEAVIITISGVAVVAAIIWLAPRCNEGSSSIVLGNVLLAGCTTERGNGGVLGGMPTGATRGW